MKRASIITALSLTAVLGAAPFLASADGDRWERGEGYEHHRGGKMMAAQMKEYSAEEIRVMAQAHALRRYGPGTTVAMEKTEDGTFLMKVRDADNNLLRENEFNLYGMPVRGKRSD
ncbi:hypothetical protein QQM79_07015 [Marinobacteraceae bacterium S3BR75-40.1]